MKILKTVGKIAIVYAIGFVFVYSLVINVRKIDEKDSRILQEKNYEEYYVYEK